MRFLVSTLIFLSVHLLSAAEQLQPPQDWVKRLNSVEFDQRESATIELWERTTADSPLIEELIKSTEPEVRSRTLKVLDWHRYHLHPKNTAAEIKLARQMMSQDLEPRLQAIDNWIQHDSDKLPLAASLLVSSLSNDIDGDSKIRGHLLDLGWSLEEYPELLPQFLLPRYSPDASAELISNWWNGGHAELNQLCHQILLRSQSPEKTLFQLKASNSEQINSFLIEAARYPLLDGNPAASSRFLQAGILPNQAEISLLRHLAALHITCPELPQPSFKNPEHLASYRLLHIRGSQGIQAAADFLKKHPEVSQYSRLRVETSALLGHWQELLTYPANNLGPTPNSYSHARAFISSLIDGSPAAKELARKATHLAKQNTWTSLESSIAQHQAAAALSFARSSHSLRSEMRLLIAQGKTDEAKHQVSLNLAKSPIHPLLIQLLELELTSLDPKNRPDLVKLFGKQIEHSSPSVVDIYLSLLRNWGKEDQLFNEVVKRLSQDNFTLGSTTKAIFANDGPAAEWIYRRTMREDSPLQRLRMVQSILKDQADSITVRKVLTDSLRDIGHSSEARDAMILLITSQHFSEENRAQAIRSLSKMPLSIKQRTRLSDRLSQSQLTHLALPIWTAAAKDQPTSTVVHLQLARCYASANQIKLSQKHQTLAKQLCLASPLYLKAFIKDLERRHEPQAANQVRQQLISLLALDQAESVNACRQLGSHMFKAGNYAESARLLSLHHFGTITSPLRYDDVRSYINSAAVLAESYGLAALQKNNEKQAIHWLSRCQNISIKHDTLAQAIHSHFIETKQAIQAQKIRSQRVKTLQEALKQSPQDQKLASLLSEWEKA